MNLDRYVHVIMPVDSDPLFSERRFALERGIRSYGLEARFPCPASERPPFDLPSFLNEICRADAIIADLSYERPSCYYELGIVEAIGKQVHLIAQKDTPIHQCAGRLNVRYYRDMTDLTRTVRECLAR